MRHNKNFQPDRRAEKGFRQAVTLSHGALTSYFLESPISIVLIVLTVLSVATPIYLNRSKRSRHNQEIPQENKEFLPPSDLK